MESFERSKEIERDVFHLVTSVGQSFYLHLARGYQHC